MENILIIQTAFLGDLILTTPLFSAIRKKFPDSKITVLVKQGLGSVLNHNPNIDNIIEVDKKKVNHSIFGFLSFLKQIHSLHFTICISVHFSYRSSIITFCSGAKLRMGYKTAGFSFLLNHKVDRPLLGLHETIKIRNLCGDLFSDEDFPKIPELFPGGKEKLKIENLLKNHEIEPGKFLLICPSSVWETKRLPSHKFRNCIEYILSESTYKVILGGSRDDQKLCNIIQSGFGERVINFSGQTSLLEFAELVSHAGVVISNDSSPVHFASAMNTPLVQVYGATIPDFGYYGLSERFLVSEVKDLSCRSCGIHGGRKCPEKHFRCMEEQDGKRIAEMALRLIT